jgi:signal transduction histidine kinase
MSDALSFLQAARRLHEVPGVKGVLRELDAAARELLGFSRLWLGLVTPPEAGSGDTPQLEFHNLAHIGDEVQILGQEPLHVRSSALLERLLTGDGEELPGRKRALRCVMPLEVGAWMRWSLTQATPAERPRSLWGVVVGEHPTLPADEWAQTQALLAELVGVAGHVLERENVGHIQRQRVSQVSHELRTPLSSVMAFCEMLADGDAGKLNSKQSRFVGRISSNGVRLQRIVEDLLTITRLDAGTAAPLWEWCAVSGLMEDTAMNFWPQAGARSITLQVDAPAELPRVRTDPERLQQALSNLVDNAIKYSPTGSEIRLWAECVGGGGRAPARWVRVAVTDQGAGIAPEEQTRVFEEFFRCRNLSREQEAKGSGLGLPIVKRLMELLGGKVEVFSELGNGSTFSLWLPARERQAERPGRPTTKKSSNS